MAINPTDAVSAYNAAARSAGVRGVGPDVASGQGAGTALAVSPAAQDPNAMGAAPTTFSEMVRGTLQQSIATAQQGEQMSMQAIAGTADLRDVVMAVANAEINLETVVAIRDKVVNAYNEIIKMPI